MLLFPDIQKFLKYCFGKFKSDIYKMAITFNSEQINFNSKGKSLLKKWIKSIIEQEGKKVGEINYIFCSDDYLLGINQTYLKHDTYTDVITFDFNEGSSKIISGDIYISIDRVGDNAQKFKVSFEEELRRVIIHGILHLCGYLDKMPSEIKIMREKEEESLQLFSMMDEENNIKAKEKQPGD